MRGKVLAISSFAAGYNSFSGSGTVTMRMKDFDALLTALPPLARRITDREAKAPLGHRLRKNRRTATSCADQLIFRV